MIKTKIAEVFLDENDFCRIRMIPLVNEILTPEYAEELCMAVGEICAGKARKILTDTRGVRGFVPSKSRDIIRNHPQMLEYRLAEAFLFDSLANKAILSMYLQFNKPPNPTKAFNQEKDAINWLNSLDL